MPPPTLLGQLRQALRLRHYSPRTEVAYEGWARRFLRFHGMRHPRDMGEAEITRFLTHLAERGSSASTQNQALNALVFLYGKVLGIDLPQLPDLARAKRPVRLPTVLAREEVADLLAHLHGVEWLMASLLYGGGLRLMDIRGRRANGAGSGCFRRRASTWTRPAASAAVTTCTNRCCNVR